MKIIKSSAKKVIFWLLTSLALGVFLFLAVMYFISFYAPAKSYYYSLSSGVATSQPIGAPVRIQIPAVGVDATVISLGTTKDGAVDSPKDISQAGWFNLGPRPGEQGSAVIDGHYGWINQNPSVFNDLYKLKEGDSIVVTDEHGKTISFSVTKLKTYDLNAYVPDVFISNDGKSHLNLITCDGVWDSQKKTYSNRLVVFSDKQE